MLVADIAQQRALDRADLLGIAAARMEVAPGRRVGRAGHIAGQSNRPRALTRVGLGDGRQQRFGIRVLRIIVQLLGLGHLDQIADVHHRHPVGDMLDHAQIVGDEQIGEIELLLQLLQQVQHLSLDRDIQRRDRLVADDQFRVQRQRAGDPDPLALAAAKCVGITRSVLGPQAHHCEQLSHPVAERLPAGHLVDHQRLADDPPYGHARVERREGILEDDLHIGADLLELFRLQLLDMDLPQLRIIKDNLARSGFEQPDDAATRRALAAAAFAYQPERFALFNIEVDTVDGFDITDHTPQEAAVDREVLFQAAHLEQDIIGLQMCAHRSPSMATGGARRRADRQMGAGLADHLCPSAWVGVLPGYRWQRTVCRRLLATTVSSGTIVSQTPGIKAAQRGWNGQPETVE